jgi:hypothetical protein
MSPTQQARENAGYSQLRAAALANVALATWRVFELDAEALRRNSRARCERALAIIRGTRGESRPEAISERPST